MPATNFAASGSPRETEIARMPLRNVASGSQPLRGRSRARRQNRPAPRRFRLTAPESGLHLPSPRPRLRAFRSQLEPRGEGRGAGDGGKDEAGTVGSSDASDRVITLDFVFLPEN